MVKNKIQFQQGKSLFELFQNYGTEEQCHQALFKWRWPNGFRCPECGSQNYCVIKKTSIVSMSPMPSPNFGNHNLTSNFMLINQVKRAHMIGIALHQYPIRQLPIPSIR